MRRHALLAVALAAALIAGCGGADTTADTTNEPTASAAAAPTQKIAIKDFLYAPDPSTVKVGAKIAVSNGDNTPHTLTDKAGTPVFDSGTIRGRDSGSVTFSKTGTFTYYCVFHPTMKGAVTVVK